MANIVGGDVADAGAWPDVVAVEYPWGTSCTGTLVAPTLVLTAGHCVTGAHTVIIGAHDYEVGGERIAVVDAWAHDDPVHTYDVGLLVLEHAATSAPRLLVRDCVADEVIDGAAVTLAGYGAINGEGTEYETLLREAHTTVQDADCSDLTRGCNALVSPGGEVIAGGEGIDSCNGDSGGPLFLDRPDGSMLLGVTSRAAQPAEHVCGDGGIYVRVDAIADWIEATSGVALTRPACEGWNPAPAPTAEAIVVYAGDTATSLVVPNDPNADQGHSFAIPAPPRGDASVDADGRVTYTAPESYVGADDFLVAVTDDGVPPRTATVTVVVDVHPRPVARNGACSTAPGAALWLGLVSWAGVRRRRRGRTGSRDRATA